MDPETFDDKSLLLPRTYLHSHFFFFAMYYICLSNWFNELPWRSRMILADVMFGMKRVTSCGVHLRKENWKQRDIFLGISVWMSLHQPIKLFLHSCLLLTLVYLARAFSLYWPVIMPAEAAFPITTSLTLSCSYRVACLFDHVSSFIYLFCFVLFPLICTPHRPFAYSASQ
jgi:hypothetical protein